MSSIYPLVLHVNIIQRASVRGCVLPRLGEVSHGKASRGAIVRDEAQDNLFPFKTPPVNDPSILWRYVSKFLHIRPLHSFVQCPNDFYINRYFSSKVSSLSGFHAGNLTKWRKFRVPIHILLFWPHSNDGFPWRKATASKSACIQLTASIRTE